MNTTTPAVIAEIRAEMARQGVRVSDLADKTGMTVSAVSRRLNGSKLDLSDLMQFAGALSVAPSVIIDRAERAVAA